MSHNWTRQGYPEDAPAPRNLPSDDNYNWETESVGYEPVTYTSPRTQSRIEEERLGYKSDYDPKERYRSWSGKVQKDANGAPLNPTGRTGYAGLGSCSFWGPNLAADAIVTRIGENGYEVLITRKRSDRGDGTFLALPGGKMDKGEQLKAAAARELFEETRLRADFSNALIVFQGYIDDPRNTDNAWYESTGFHVHLDGRDGEQFVLGGDDAEEAMWVPLTSEPIEGMFSEHAKMIQTVHEIMRAGATA